MALLIWLIVWLIKGSPHVGFPDSSWALSLYICAALSVMALPVFWRRK